MKKLMIHLRNHSELLSMTIRNILPPQKQNPEYPPLDFKKENEVIKRIAFLPKIYLPNELKKKIPNLEFDLSGNCLFTYQTIDGHNAENFPPNTQFIVEVSYQGDSVSNKFESIVLF